MRPTGPGQSAQLLLDAVDLLAARGVPCAVVGALAVSFHGVPRSTDDADAAVWLSGTGVTPDDLLRDLRGAGFRSELKRGDIEDPIAAVMVVKDGHDNRVDLLMGVRGMDPEASARAVVGRLLDASVRIIGAEDLIAMKIFAGGPQDLEDARGVLQVSGKKVDLALLKKLTRRYGRKEARTLAALLKRLDL